MIEEPDSFDVSILLLHAYEVASHEGVFDPESCTKCAAMERSAQATAFLLATYVEQDKPS